MKVKKTTAAVVAAAGLAAAMPVAASGAPVGSEDRAAVTGQLLLEIDQDFYALDAATGIKRRLTTTGDVSEGSFSPDGRKIAYMRWVDGAWPDLWTMNTDGSNPVRLTNTPGVRERSPKWSPDGTQLVFERLDRKLANPSMAVMAARPGAAQQVVRPAESSPACPLGQAYFDPFWTARNQFVAGYFCNQYDQGDSYIAVFSKAGALVKKYAVGDTFQLDVDPTGTKVVHRKDTGNPRVAVLDLTSGRDRVLTPRNSFSWTPIWSPDGSSIAWYYAPTSGAANTFVMNADGSDKRLLTRNHGEFVYPIDWRS